uniref:Ig-like domain-containing protein n=1 Tax=Podarcis muralis TaxID=64176 RepID=A0A670K039_PODMU
SLLQAQNWSWPENISSGQIITQTPASLQASLGDRVTIQCKAASSVSNNMLLIYGGSTRFEGTPDRFSGSYSGNDFSFTINGVHAKDEGEYYCGQGYSFPLHSDTLQYKNQFSGLRQKEGMTVGVLQQQQQHSAVEHLFPGQIVPGYIPGTISNSKSEEPLANTLLSPVRLGLH